jgi:hypothetical protein
MTRPKRLSIAHYSQLTRLAERRFSLKRPCYPVGMNLELDLTSVRAKLARSQEHIQTIKDEVVPWTERHPYSILPECNADSTRYSLILRVNEPPPFQRWSLIIADAFNNLRAALDHLVFAVAMHEAAPNPPAYEGKLQFPIADDRKRFDGMLNGNYLGTISDPIRTAIEAAQPYNRPHPALPPLLSILRDLTNRDKHRLLQMAFGAAAEGNIGFTGDFPQDGRQWNQIAHSGEIKDGTEVFALVCDRPTPNMKFDRHIVHVVVAIQHGKRDPSGPDGSDRDDFISIYDLISGEVRRVIYDVSALVK